MPDRIIKDTIRTSENVNKLSDFHFRLWVYLITYVNDEGCGRADAKILKTLVFPFRPTVTMEQIKCGIDKLETLGMIELFEKNGESWLRFPKFLKHQDQPFLTKPKPKPAQKETTDLFAEFAAGDGELLEALRDFEQMRTRIRKPLTDKAKALLLGKLQKFPQAEWVEIINQSVLNSWQGIFPLKRDDAPTGRRTQITFMDV